MSDECESLLPGEHPEYSLGFAFSLLLCEILFVPEVGLHLFKVHSPDSHKGVFCNGGSRVCRCLLHGRSSNFSDVLGAVGPVTSSVELALVALVLWLSAVLDAMPLGSTVETLVVSWQHIPFALSFLLLIPQEGTDILFCSWS